MPLLKSMHCILLFANCLVLGSFFLHVGKAMKGFKKTHLTVDDCEALARSAEGSSSLTQPLSQRKSRSDVNRGLYPTHRTRRRQGGTLIVNTLKSEGFGGEKCWYGVERKGIVQSIVEFVLIGEWCQVRGVQVEIGWVWMVHGKTGLNLHLRKVKRQEKEIPWILPCMGERIHLRVCV